MKPSDKNLANAYIWLFKAGFDDRAVDVEGVPLVQSLAAALDATEREARYSGVRRSERVSRVENDNDSVTEDEVTERYERSELTRLLRVVECG